MDSAVCEAKLVAIKVANSADKGHAMVSNTTEYMKCYKPLQGRALCTRPLQHTWPTHRRSLFTPQRGWVSFLDQEGLTPTPAKGGGSGGGGGGGGGPNPLVDADMQKELPVS